jgi:hypothetical protein
MELSVKLSVVLCAVLSAALGLPANNETVSYRNPKCK